MCALVVLSFVFHTKPRDWLEKRLQMTYFVLSGT